MKTLKSIGSLFHKGKTSERFYKVSGQATFQVDVKITGDSPYSNCVLSVHAFNNLENKIAIAAKYKWYRIYNLARVEVKASGNSYHVSPLDIGCNVVVDIIPMAEEGEDGNATVEFGPINLDPGMKKTLQGIIRSGGTRFVVDKMQLVGSGANMRSSVHSRKSYQSNHIGGLGGNFSLFKTSFRISKEGSEFAKKTSHNMSSMSKHGGNSSGLQIGLGETYEMISGPGSKCVTFNFENTGKNRELKKLVGEQQASFKEVQNGHSGS